MTKLHKILHDTQNVSLTCTVVKNFNVKIPGWRTADIFKNRKIALSHDDTVRVSAETESKAPEGGY